MSKKTILILLLFIGQFLNAQSYKPLLDQFNEWHFTTCDFGCSTDIYYTNGDTVVNGISYKILDGYHFISRTFLLREETANQKVFLAKISNKGVQEYLLYDFSMQPGDSITMQNPISPFPPVGGYFILDSIVGRPLADGNDYRYFYFSPSPTNTISAQTATWVEGVGSLSLINAPGGHPDINSVGQLSCFFKNGMLFYSNLDSIQGCAPVHFSSRDFEGPFDQIMLYSRPNSQTCVLENTSGVSKIGIFDISGKRLFQIQNLEDKNTISFDISGFQKGVYLVRVSLNGKFQTFKFVCR